jgi:hypothetical protein
MSFGNNALDGHLNVKKYVQDSARTYPMNRTVNSQEKQPGNGFQH